MKRPVSLTAALSVVCLTAACGAQVEEDSAPSNEKATVTNCGTTHEVDRPSAPVAYDVSAIDKMFALGLADRMRGIVLPKTVSSVVQNSPYAQDYERVETVGEDVLNQEGLVDAEADWVFAGWQAGFSPERGITPESLQKLGIDSYLQEETCFSYDAKGSDAVELPVEATGMESVDATYRDLVNLGALFGVQDKATEVIRGMEEQRKALAERPERKRAPKVFVYDSGTTEPYTAGRRTAPHDIIEMAGATNVTGDLDARWDVVGWESVVKADPDAVVVVDYNKQPLQEKLDYLRNQSPIKDSTAVREGNIHVIDYGEAVSGPRNMTAAEELADFLDEKGLR